MAPKYKMIRLGDAEGIAIERERTTREIAATARAMLHRYAEIVKRETPIFSRAEWLAIFDATLGAIYEGPEQATWWRDDVRSVVVYDGAAKKWQVSDADRFVAKVDGLSYAQCVAVLDVAERYHAACERGEDPQIPGTAD